MERERYGPRSGVVFNDEEFLAHHGVKGQKWGVRKQYEKTGRKRRGIISRVRYKLEQKQIAKQKKLRRKLERLKLEDEVREYKGKMPKHIKGYMKKELAVSTVENLGNAVNNLLKWRMEKNRTKQAKRAIVKSAIDAHAEAYEYRTAKFKAKLEKNKKKENKRRTGSDNRKVGKDVIERYRTEGRYF